MPTKFEKKCFFKKNLISSHAECAIAACQLDVVLGDVETNYRRILSRFSNAAETGAKLIVFPECALSGYCFDSTSEARSAAIPCPSDFWEELHSLCDKFQAFCICGFLEQDGPLLYNSAGLFGPGRYVRKYRKMHTLVLGVDRFVTPGDLGFPVFELPFGRVGINLCYDQRFPESARSLMLSGAQLIVVPTNEPIAASDLCNLLTPARAYENHVYYLWVNRMGEERGVKFMGATQLVDPKGKLVFLLGENEEKTGFASIDLNVADQKHMIRKAGEYELDLIGDRVPWAYANITKTSD
jgi:predicted amidohydrolase